MKGGPVETALLLWEKGGHFCLPFPQRTQPNGNETNDSGGGNVARASQSKSQLTDLLKTIPLFSGLSRSELNRIAGIVKEVEFPAGRAICKEGETGVGLHVIIEGETKVLIGGRTRRRLGAGAYFGEIALLDGGPRTATVIAETPVRTLSIPAWSFKTALKAQPNLALKMLEETARRLRTADSSFTN
jgi:CRP/FNR family cyclic AMP-dependent transcriptional regulator